MPLAEKPAVIRMAGSLSQRELATVDVDDIIEEADAIIYEVTRKDDWVEGEYGFTLARHAANRYAAATLLDQFYDPKNKAKQYMEQYEAYISKLKTLGYGGSKDSGNPSYHMAIGSYKENALKKGPFVSHGFFGAESVNMNYEAYQHE